MAIVREPPLPPQGLPQVTLSGVGVVTLTTLDVLRDVCRAEQEVATALASEAAEAEGLAEDRAADAGALLVPRRALWPVPPDLARALLEADRLVARIARLDERGAGRGWLGRTRRTRAAVRLRQLLLMIARAGGEAGIDVPGVEPLLEEAVELEARAHSLRSALEAAYARLGQLEGEIRLREEAHRQLGFDSLHLAAHLQAHGTPVVQSPVELAAGESAHLVVDAALAPPIAMVAGDARTSESGLLALTGIYEWVGARRAGAAPVPAAPPVDTGVLVVTSQRLVFGGRAVSVAVPLARMLAMDVYDDALAVLQLGRAAGDVFLVARPGLVAFYTNWVSERVSPLPPSR